ncbi:hypothetical protein CWI84_05110 [Idiomarina tyrosinivorans]|uniref:Uncharacterized protein n=1 Tax=Idiomarina tyrosinivorans TaxID=1445662 RepID=A0A432ZRG2_9GAMM|nr:hypothetical protein [Idiomarina tyrosinivorans]RUO80442.1 hypothetical protein CWI84_05110 [Idiomarina tyrosinivorans]
MAKWSWLIVTLMLLAVIRSDSVPSQQQRLWQQAIDGGAEAQFLVAQQYWQQQQHSQAWYWWQRAGEAGQASAIKQLQKHFPRQRRRWLQLAVDNGSALAIAELAQLELRQRTFGDWLSHWQKRWRSAVVQRFRKQCALPVSVRADHPVSAQRVYRLVEHLLESPLAEFDWCFQWHSAPLHCNYQDSARVTCNASDSRRELRLVKQGGAYATPTLLYLPRAANFTVFLHELGHWLGLADEYPMASALAQQFCHGQYRQQPLNIVVTQSQRLTASELKQLYRRLPWRFAVASWQQLATQEQDGYWRLGSNHAFGLHPAATCDQVKGVYAWKAVAQTTAMQVQESRVWPPLYLELIQQRLATNND